jgi:superfamily II DNA/RNA helicase
MNSVLSKAIDYDQQKKQILIFTQTKREADQVCLKLRERKIAAAAIHSDKTQQDRTRSLQHFRDKAFLVLVATDVAARGLDIKGIEAVINLDLPQSMEDYVHRIGRTGRAGMLGSSFTYVTESTQASKLQQLIQIMKQTNQTIPQELIDLSGGRFGGGGGGGSRNSYGGGGGGNSYGRR